MYLFDAATARLRRGVWVAAISLLVSGCASTTRKAPVEQRQPAPLPTAAATATPAPPPVAPAAESPPPPPQLPGAENAGKPGYYTVKPGDTMIRIGLENGQNWRDIARWNGIVNPGLIEVGQVLRVVPPAGEAVAVRPVTPAGQVETRPLDGATAPAAPPTASTSGTAPPAAAAAAGDADENVVWSWPAAGPVLAVFDDNKSKGLVISGRSGDPVLAAADGRVVYVGSGIRGYGNLVIVKHNTTYLTAYAHNQALLVKEDQVVRRGQKIAEMGSSDADRVQLHFEIRRLGRPVDPARLLPPR